MPSGSFTTCNGFGFNIHTERESRVDVFPDTARSRGVGYSGTMARSRCVGFFSVLARFASTVFSVRMARLVYCGFLLLDGTLFSFGVFCTQRRAPVARVSYEPWPRGYRVTEPITSQISAQIEIARAM